ncbi:MAG: hypothetical protein M0R37_10675 [Bacteroidales bacterium]|jgi:hypothetical protein|nr:hypothetical protein [Bacteroidales bacterium]
MIPIHLQETLITLKPQKFSRLFLSFTIHDNRVEIKDGMFPLVKKSSIPFRSITSVEVAKLTKQLIIHTSDGKKHTYALGGFGKAQACRDAIAAAL